MDRTCGSRVSPFALPRLSFGDNSLPPAISIMVTNDDAADLTAARNGDHEAFARLYDRHGPVILSLCRRACHGSSAEAEDACQETFLRAYRRLDRAEDAGRLRSWLYAIARRVCSERRRSAARRRHHEDEAMVLNSVAHDHHREAQAAVLQRSEALARLSSALDELDDRERLAVHLYYLESDPVAAAREALGLSRSGYYKLLAKARDRLVALMREVSMP